MISAAQAEIGVSRADDSKSTLPKNFNCECNRVGQLLNGIALLAANRPTWHAHSAVAIELRLDPAKQDTLSLVIRVSQNGSDGARTVNSLNSLLCTIIRYTERCSRSERREGKSSTPSSLLSI